MHTLSLWYCMRERPPHGQLVKLFISLSKGCRQLLTNHLLSCLMGISQVPSCKMFRPFMSVGSL